VTGAATIDLDAVAARIPQIRQHARLPVGVGFGIRDAATARAISGVADAVVIGSRIVQLLEEAPREQAVQYLTDFIAEIRQALDA
jgi:tryptophan synthase alpha chain